MYELTKAQEQKLFNALHNGSVTPPAQVRKETFVLNENIYRWEDTDAIITIIAGLRKGDEIILRREEDNDNYNCIVGVYDKLRQRIGYLGGGNRKIIARLMDAGKQFRAELAPRNDIETLTDTEWITTNDEFDIADNRLHSIIDDFLTINIYWVE